MLSSSTFFCHDVVLTDKSVLLGTNWSCSPSSTSITGCRPFFIRIFLSSCRVGLREETYFNLMLVKGLSRQPWNLELKEQQEVMYRGQGRAFQAQGIVFKGWMARVWCPSREKRSPLWLQFREVHKDQMIQSFVGHGKVLFQVQRQYFKILKRSDLISFCFVKIILDVFWRLDVARIETGNGPI